MVGVFAGVVVGGDSEDVLFWGVEELPFFEVANGFSVGVEFPVDGVGEGYRFVGFWGGDFVDVYPIYDVWCVVDSLPHNAPCVKVVRFRYTYCSVRGHCRLL